MSKISFEKASKELADFVDKLIDIQNNDEAIDFLVNNTDNLEDLIKIILKK